MKIDFSTKQNFGWKPQTHAAITEYAIKSFPKLKKYKGTIVAASQLPDLALYDLNLINPQAHNYFGVQLYKFGTPKDAFSFYVKFFREYLSAFMNNKPDVAMTKAGEALHFLQDIANPLHTNPKYQGLLSTFRHSRYEKLADKKVAHISEFIPQNTEILPEFYIDNFLNTYHTSSKMPHPFKKEELKNWDNSIKNSLTLAYDATRTFLDDVSALL